MSLFNQTGAIMKPTNKLRLVEHSVFRFRGNAISGAVFAATEKVLQQWWVETGIMSDEDRVIGGEWRDVPIEKEY